MPNKQDVENITLGNLRKKVTAKKVVKKGNTYPLQFTKESLDTVCLSLGIAQDIKVKDKGTEILYLAILGKFALDKNLSISKEEEASLSITLDTLTTLNFPSKEEEEEA